MEFEAPPDEEILDIHVHQEDGQAVPVSQMFRRAMVEFLRNSVAAALEAERTTNAGQRTAYNRAWRVRMKARTQQLQK